MDFYIKNKIIMRFVLLLLMSVIVDKSTRLFSNIGSNHSKKLFTAFVNLFESILSGLIVLANAEANSILLYFLLHLPSSM